MQAIKTRYLGPTNHKGSRIKATAASGTLTVSYDYTLNSADNHAAAAEALVVKLGWSNWAELSATDEWVAFNMAHGALPDGDYCHVFVRLAVPSIIVRAENARLDSLNKTGDLS